MKKQIIDKAYFLLQSMISRLEDGEDFFISVEASFKAGMKEFKLTAKLNDDNKLEYIFSGEKHVNGAAEFCEEIVALMPNYDEMTLDYNERGRKLSLFCDNRDAKITNTKTSQNSFVDNIVKTEDSPKGDICTSSVIKTSILGNREYLIKAGEATDLLKEIGIVGENGKVKNDKIRKYNQIDHFVELIKPLLESLCNKYGGKRPVRIIDCGCGKSYLSFVLNYYIKEVMGRRCYFTGLDYNPIVIEDSKRMAEHLGYKNMEFIQTDIKKYEPECEYDLLLTLHACDVATDYALNFAMKNNVSHIVCVPCCHRQMNSNYNLKGFENVMKHGILKARIADALTDGLRATYLEGMGYDVSVVEYISPLDTPKNLMIRAEKVKNEIDYDKIKEFCDMANMLNTKLEIGNM